MSETFPMDTHRRSNAVTLAPHISVNCTVFFQQLVHDNKHENIKDLHYYSPVKEICRYALDTPRINNDAMGTEMALYQIQERI